MKILLAIWLLLLFPPVTRAAGNDADSLLSVLKTEISKKDSYDRHKERRISGLRKAYQQAKSKSNIRQYHTALAMFEVFQDYQFDSTYHYVRELVSLSARMNDEKKLAENRLKLGMTLITAGMFKETFDCLREIKPGLLDNSTRKSYYILYSWAFSDLAKYNGDRIYAPEDMRKKYLYLDSAIALCIPGSFERAILEAQQEAKSGRHPVSYFVELSKKKLSLHEQAMVATGLSSYRKGPEKIRLLATAAINDVRSSTYRALALLNLGTALHDQGNHEDAYFFLQQALIQANHFGSRLQRYQVIHELSKVSAEKEKRAAAERQRFLIYLASVIVFAIIASLVGFIVFVQFKRVRSDRQTIRVTNRILALKNQKLWEEGRIKEEYIGYFFSELSRYIIKLDKLKNNAQRKAKSGNVEELLRLLEQIDIPSERHEFFATFDRIFLKLFPDFVEVVNAMFKPEDQMIPKTKGALTAQLRILALMRLGIEKNETIAGILQNTVNTVYTYRFRAKSKALVSAADFEQQIMGIKVVTTEQ